MKRLQWLDLAWTLLRGDALDKHWIREYIPDLRSRVDRLEVWAKEKEAGPDVLGKVVGKAAIYFGVESGVRMLIQLFAFHVAWASLILATILYISDSFCNNGPVAAFLAEKTSNLGVSPLVATVLSAACISVAMIAARQLEPFRGSEQRVLRYTARFVLVATHLLGAAAFALFAVIGAPLIWPTVKLWHLLLLSVAAFVVAKNVHQRHAHRILLSVAALSFLLMGMRIYLQANATNLIMIAVCQQVFVNFCLQHSRNGKKVAFLPAAVHVGPQALVAFQLKVPEELDGDLSLRTCGGNVDDCGNFTAGSEPGAYGVCAFSLRDQKRLGEARVAIKK